MSDTDAKFSGSIPAIYDRYLGPLLFEPYARELADRVSGLKPKRVLETAAGTGIVTRELARVLGQEASITATDLNQAMIDVAGSSIPGVIWQACDATELPFDSETFDAVACQFGVMFFPDKAQAYREAARVLQPGGTFVFVVWDSIEHNDITLVVDEVMEARFPADTPKFMRRTPFGYNDVDAITAELTGAGFDSVSADVVALTTRCPSPHDAAMGICQGTPLRGEIEGRDSEGLQAATDAAADALRTRFGDGPFESGLRAIVFTATK